MRIVVYFCPPCAAMLRSHAVALQGDEARAIKEHVHELCERCFAQMPPELAASLQTGRSVLGTSRAVRNAKP